MRWEGASSDACLTSMQLSPQAPKHPTEASLIWHGPRLRRPSSDLTARAGGGSTSGLTLSVSLCVVVVELPHESPCVAGLRTVLSNVVLPHESPCVAGLLTVLSESGSRMSLSASQVSLRSFPDVVVVGLSSSGSSSSGSHDGGSGHDLGQGPPHPAFQWMADREGGACIESNR